MNNYIYKPLQSFVLYWLFPLLLVLTLFLVYLNYINTPYLCDDNVITLYNLKTRLTWEISDYRKYIIDYDSYSNIRNQWMEFIRIRPQFRNIEYEVFLRDELQNSRIQITESLNKIRRLESVISTMDSNFSSSVNHSIWDYITAFRNTRG